MTEPNNTPNDPSNQESLDDVLRGLSAEGSEEEQSLDDILASLSEDESQSPAPETLNIDELDALDIDDDAAESTVEPEPTPIPTEADSFSQTIDVSAAATEPAATELGNISSESDEASPFSTPADEIIEPTFTGTADSDSTPDTSDWIDAPLSSPPQSVEPTIESGQPEPSLELTTPAPEESISFEIAGSEPLSMSEPSIPETPVPETLATGEQTNEPEVSPFEPPSTLQPDDAVEPPFATPADTVEPALTGTADSDLTADTSDWLDESPGTAFQPQASERAETDAVPETPPEPPLPELEEVESFEIASTGFEPPTGDEQTSSPASPFEPPTTSFEPAVTAAEADDGDPALEGQASPPPLEAPAPAFETEGVPIGDTVESAFAESGFTTDPQPTDPPAEDARSSEVFATASNFPEDAPEPEAPAFNVPSDPLEDASGEEPLREELELTDSDPEFSGPELPNLPPLAQPEPVVSLSQASIDAPGRTNLEPPEPPLTLKTLLDRPRHRWMVPFGFIMILAIFGVIIFGALRGGRDSEPTPDPQEQQSSLPHEIGDRTS